MTLTPGTSKAGGRELDGRTWEEIPVVGGRARERFLTAVTRNERCLPASSKRHRGPGPRQ